MRAPSEGKSMQRPQWPIHLMLSIAVSVLAACAAPPPVTPSDGDAYRKSVQKLALTVRGSWYSPNLNNAFFTLAPFDNLMQRLENGLSQTFALNGIPTRVIPRVRQPPYLEPAIPPSLDPGETLMKVRVDTVDVHT